MTPRRFSLVVITAPLVIALAAAGALVVADADLSATPEVRNDLVFRASTDEGTGSVYRHDDPSGHVQFLPADIVLHRALRRGELPHWEPHAGGGSSPIRRFQLAVFHPFRVASVLVPERQAQSFTNLLALAFALSGMVVLLVRAGASRPAALVCAGAFAFSSHNCTTLVLDFPLVVAHLPWLALALDVALSDKHLRSLFAAAAVLALLIVSGHPGIAVAICALSIAFAAARAKMTVGAIGRLALIGVAGLSAAAVALVPFALELSSAWTYKYESKFGVLYAPFSWRWWPSMVTDLVLFDEPGTYGDFFNVYSWLGPAVVALAVVGAIATLRRRLWWPAALLLVTFAFCVPGPWMEWGRSVPGLWTIKVWYLYPCLPFAACLCAAFGWDALCARVPALRRPLVVVAVAAIVWTTAPARAALWVVPHRGAFLPPSAVLDAVRASPGMPVRVTAPPGHTHAPNLAAVTGIDDLRTHGATLSRRYHRWFEIVDPLVTTRTFPSTRATPIADHPLMKSFNVGFILEPRIGGDDWHVDPNGSPDDVRRIQSSQPLELVIDDGFVRLWRVPGARARAGPARPLRIVDGVDAADAALRGLGSETHDVVEADASTRGRLEEIAAAPDRIAVVAFARPHAAELVIDVDADGDALLVVQELYEEGWTARVDGVEASVLPVNLVARGVLVPAGRHVVEMRYRTPGFTAGALLSLLPFLLAALLLTREWRRTRARGTSSPPRS